MYVQLHGKSMASRTPKLKDTALQIQGPKIRLDIREERERERERERDWAHLGGTTFRRKTKLQHLPRFLICECSSNSHFSGNWSRPRIFLLLLLLLLLLQLLLLTSILPNWPKKRERQLGSRMTYKSPPHKQKKGEA